MSETMYKHTDYAEIEVSSLGPVPFGFAYFTPGDTGFTRAVKNAGDAGVLGLRNKGVRVFDTIPVVSTLLVTVAAARPQRPTSRNR